MYFISYSLISIFNWYFHTFKSLPFLYLFHYVEKNTPSLYNYRVLRKRLDPESSIAIINAQSVGILIALKDLLYLFKQIQYTVILLQWKIFLSLTKMECKSESISYWPGSSGVGFSSPGWASSIIIVTWTIDWV